MAKRATKPLTPPATASCGMDIAGGAGASPAGSEASTDPIDVRRARDVVCTSACFSGGTWTEMHFRTANKTSLATTLYLASTLSRMATNRFFSFVMNDGA